MGHLITLFQKARTIVRDGFNRADSALTMGKADTGQTWVPLSGTWGISGNQAYTTDTVAIDVTTLDAGVSNSIISATIKFSTNEGIVFRLTDSSNQLIVRINSTSMALVRNVAGTATAIGSYSFTPVVGSLYSVKVICSGSSVRVFLDGAERIAVSETFNQTATKSGLRTGPSTAGRFGVFVVDPL